MPVAERKQSRLLLTLLSAVALTMPSACNMGGGFTMLKGFLIGVLNIRESYYWGVCIRGPSFS